MNNPMNALNAMPGLSTKYQFASSETIINRMGQLGWALAAERVQRVRNAERQGYQKHQMTFKQTGEDVVLRGEGIVKNVALGGIYQRIVIVNSHDGKAGIVVRGGFFRAVCSNGMVVNDEACPVIRIRHTSTDIDERIRVAAVSTVNHLLLVAAKNHDMHQVTLTTEQQDRFRNDVLTAVWPDGSKSNIDTTVLLASRRAEDDIPTLWNMLNRAQESLMNGGLPFVDENRTIHYTRAMSGIDSTIKANQAVYQVALNTLKTLGV